MEELQSLIEQMISDISNQAVPLDDLRLQLFLNWLDAHSSRVKTANQANIEVANDGEGDLDDRFKHRLKSWFESLPMPGLLREYHLLLDEIAWWRDLDPRSLARMQKSEGRE